MATLKLTSSGGGVQSIDTPSTASNFTSTLPGTTGTLLDTNSSLPAAKLTGTVPTARLGSGTASSSTFLRGDSTYAAGGKILQVLQTVKTDTFSTTSASGTFVDITGLSVAITPVATSSKILIMIDIRGANAGSNNMQIRTLRGSTVLYVGDAGGGSRLQSSAGYFNSNADTVGQLSATFLDSPSTTSATTYKVQTVVGATSGTVFVNRTVNDTNAVYGGRFPSSITVMEVSA